MPVHLGEKVLYRDPEFGECVAFVIKVMEADMPPAGSGRCNLFAITDSGMTMTLENIDFQPEADRLENSWRRPTTDAVAEAV